MNLHLVIEALEKQYGDGTPFFDHLDETLRHPYFFLAVEREAQRLYPHLTGLIVSGKFGTAFSDWVRDVPVYPYPGDLRHEPEKALEVHHNLRGKDVVFVDDSMYKGRTADAIKTVVERDMGQWLGEVVLYDGTRNYRPASFYRYFAWHPERRKVVR